MGSSESRLTWNMARELASAVGGVWKNGDVTGSDRAGCWCCSMPSIVAAIVAVLVVGQTGTVAAGIRSQSRVALYTAHRSMGEARLTKNPLSIRMDHVVHMVEPRVSWRAGEGQPNQRGGARCCTRDEAVNSTSIVVKGQARRASRGGCVRMRKDTSFPREAKKTQHERQRQSRLRHVPTGMSEIVRGELVGEAGPSAAATLNSTKALVGAIRATRWRSHLAVTSGLPECLVE